MSVFNRTACSPRRPITRTSFRRASAALPLCICAGLLAGWIPRTVRAADPFTAEDITRIREVSSAKISPNGTLIAYTLRVPRTPDEDENGPAWSELHISNVGGSTRPFVTGRVNVDNVDWLPDGTKITFTAKFDGDKYKCLYAIPVDGGQAQRQSDHKADVGAYAWHPDGRRFAFLAHDPEPEALKDARKAGFNQKIYEEDWRFTRVFIGGDESRRLDLPGSASAIAWSPDGSKLAVALAPTPGNDSEMMFRRIHFIDPATGQSLGQVQTAGKIGDFCFSPDSRHLALIAALDVHDPSEGRIMVVPTTGGATLELLPALPGHVRGCAWANNELLMVLTHEGCGSNLYKATIDGRAQKRLLTNTPTFLQSMSLSSNGRCFTFLGEAPTHPAEVCFMNLGDAGPLRITDVNPWLAERALAKQEVISYKARDGIEIQGPLLYPLNYDATQRYPLVMIVHGGPEAHVAQQWVTSSGRPGQLLAARGFAVFYPNYRGSTGRGVAFSKMDHRDLAGKEFDDLVDGVEHLVGLGLVDRARVGITGASYGGYATAWGATKLSEHFAAGVMSVGLSDLTSFFGTTDIPYEMQTVHARVWPWEDRAFFIDRSPLTHAQQGRTPLLILHGEADDRVHPSQSLAMYRYLRLLAQAPVRLVLYPGEGHGNQKAAARYDYTLRLLQWMEHYLSGPDRRTASPPPYELEYKLKWKAADSD